MTIPTTYAALSAGHTLSVAEQGLGHERLQSIADPLADASPDVARYIRSAMALNTHRAYRSDLIDFHKWGGYLPAKDHMVANYLADRAESHSPSTLARRLVALAQAHKWYGYPNPCASELVRATIRGIRRVRGLAQRRVDPLVREDLLQLLEVIPPTTRGARDRALLLIGFAGAFRRSELAEIKFDHLRFVPQGLLITLPRSKTDQEGKGRMVAIPWARTHACAVKSLNDWINHVAVTEGPVFRSVDKRGSVSNRALADGSIALIIKSYAKKAGLNPHRFSGHSLRAGLVTSAALCGVSSWKIRQQTGHRSDAIVQRYIRNASLFAGNAAGEVM